MTSGCVKTCFICEQDKVERRVEARLLKPLLILEKPWVSVSMDFVSGFPKVNNLSLMMVVMGRFSKCAIFMAMSESCTADVVVNLFHRNVVKHFSCT